MQKKVSHLQLSFIFFCILLSGYKVYPNRGVKCRTDPVNDAVIYRDRVHQANGMINKPTKNRDHKMIICLWHDGYPNAEGSKVSDDRSSKETGTISRLMHDYLPACLIDPITCKNKQDGDIAMNRAGPTGIISGRRDFEFTKFSGKKIAKSHTISVSQKTGG